MYKLFCILLLSCAAFSAKSQDGSSLGDRIFFGGNLGLAFGNITVIEVSPFAGYRFTDRFSSAIGPIYIYQRIKEIDFETSIYGGMLFSRYQVSEDFLLHAEYQQLSLEAYDFFLDEVRRTTVPLFLVGGGYSIPIGERSRFNLLVLFDLIEDQFSPYSNPIIRGGFLF